MKPDSIDKYLAYLEATIPLRGHYKTLSKVSYKVADCIAVILVVAAALWIAPVGVDSVELSGTLTRAGCGIYAVCFAYLTLSTAALLSRYIYDLQQVIDADRPLANSVSHFCVRKVVFLTLSVHIDL